MSSVEKNAAPKSNILLRWLPGLLISAIAIFALTRFVDIDSTLLIIRSTNILYFFLMIAFTLGFLLVRAVGWRALLGNRPTYWQTFFKLNEGYLINNIFPFKLGEISRAVFMGATMKVNPGQILSTIVVERVIDLFILAIFLLILLPFAIGMDWIRQIAWVILILVIVGLVGLFFVSRNYQTVRGWLEKYGNKIPLVSKYLLPFLFAILEGFQTMQRPGQLVKGFLGILGSWVVSFVQYSLLILLLIPGSQFWWGAFANTILALGVALPSAPAGLGIFESSIVAAFGIFHINQESALAYALIMHITQFLLTASLGLFALFKDGYSLRGLFTNLLAQQQEQLGKDHSGGELG